MPIKQTSLAEDSPYAYLHAWDANLIGRDLLQLHQQRQQAHLRHSMDSMVRSILALSRGHCCHRNSSVRLRLDSSATQLRSPALTSKHSEIMTARNSSCSMSSLAWPRLEIAFPCCCCCCCNSNNCNKILPLRLVCSPPCRQRARPCHGSALRSAPGSAA